MKDVVPECVGNAPEKQSIQVAWLEQVSSAPSALERTETNPVNADLEHCLAPLGESRSTPCARLSMPTKHRFPLSQQFLIVEGPFLKVELDQPADARHLSLSETSSNRLEESLFGFITYADDQSTSSASRVLICRIAPHVNIQPLLFEAVSGSA